MNTSHLDLGAPMRPVPTPAPPPPATTAARRPDAKLLWMSPTAHQHHHLGDLPTLLDPGDLLVVNDAATLPASLRGHHPRTGAELELRLLAPREPGRYRAWRAIAFGRGDWRTPTEHRPPPPPLAEGDALAFDGLDARVEGIDDPSGRLLSFSFLGPEEALLPGIYHAGRPVQYAYHEAPLALWDHQTPFAARPVALEPPSAALHFTWDLVFRLRARGIRVAALTHATGISSTGSDTLDGLLPVPEAYEIPPSTVALIHQTHTAGRRVVAVGTGVTRALEGVAARWGELRPGAGITAYRLAHHTPRRVVDGLLTGIHETTSSHFRLMEAFLDRRRLEDGAAEALAQGYLWHEYGDLCLVLP